MLTVLFSTVAPYSSGPDQSQETYSKYSIVYYDHCERVHSCHIRVPTYGGKMVR